MPLNGNTELLCIMCLYRVSRSQMVQALWRRSNAVDKPEMDALFDVAMSCSETSSASSGKKNNRSSRKRPREQDNKTEGQGMNVLLNVTSGLL